MKRKVVCLLICSLVFNLPMAAMANEVPEVAQTASAGEAAETSSTELSGDHTEKQGEAETGDSVETDNSVETNKENDTETEEINAIEESDESHEIATGDERTEEDAEKIENAEPEEAETTIETENAEPEGTETAETEAVEPKETEAVAEEADGLEAEKPLSAAPVTITIVPAMAGLARTEVEVNVQFDNQAESLNALLAQTMPGLKEADRATIVAYYKEYLYDGGPNEMMSLFSGIKKITSSMGWERSTDMANSDMMNGKIVYRVDKEGKKYISELTAEEKVAFDAAVVEAVPLIGLTAVIDGEGIILENDTKGFSYQINFGNPMYDAQAYSLDALLTSLYPKLPSEDKAAFVTYYKQYLYAGNDSKMMSLFKMLREATDIMGWESSTDMGNSDMMNGKVIYKVDKEGELYVKNLNQADKDAFVDKIIHAVSSINLSATAMENGIRFENLSLDFEYEYKFLTEETNGNGGDINGPGNGGLGSGGSDNGTTQNGNLDEETIQDSLAMFVKLMSSYFPALESGCIGSFQAYAEKYIRAKGDVSSIMSTYVNMRMASEVMGWNIVVLSDMSGAEVSGNGKLYYNLLTAKEKEKFQQYIIKAGSFIDLDVTFSESEVTFQNSEYHFHETIVFKTDVAAMSDSADGESKKGMVLNELGKEAIIRLYTGLLSCYLEDTDKESRDKILRFVEDYVEQDKEPAKLFNMFTALGRVGSIRGSKASIDLSEVKEGDEKLYFNGLDEEGKARFKSYLQLAFLDMGLTYEFKSDYIMISNEEQWNIKVEFDEILVSAKPNVVKASAARKDYKEMDSEEKGKFEELIIDAFNQVELIAGIHNGYLSVSGSDGLLLNLNLADSEKTTEDDSSAVTEPLTNKENNETEKQTEEAENQREQEQIEQETQSENAGSQVLTSELTISLDDSILKISNPSLELSETMNADITKQTEKPFVLDAVTDALQNEEKLLRLNITTEESGVNLSFIMKEPVINISNSKDGSFQKTIAFKEISETADQVPVKEKPAVVAAETNTKAVEELATKTKSADETAVKVESKLGEQPIAEAIKDSDTKANKNQNYVFVNQSTITFFDGLLVKYFPLLSQEDRTAIEVYVDQYEAKQETSTLMMAYSNMRMACESMGFTVDTDFTKMMEGEVRIDVADDGEKYYLNLTEDQKEDFQYFVKKAAGNVGLTAKFTEKAVIFSNPDFDFELTIEFQKDK